MMKSHRKLAIVLPSYFEQSLGGAELQVKYLLECARERNFEINYIYIDNGTPVENPHQINLWPISLKSYVQKIGKIKFPYLKELRHNLNNIRPDIVYNRTGTALTLECAKYGMKNNVGTFFHIAHDRDLEVKGIKTINILKRYEKNLVINGVRKSQTIIAQTNYQKQLLYNNFSKDCKVIFNGHPKCDQHVKPELLTVLWIANWKKMKQPELFVRLVEEGGFDHHTRFVMLGKVGKYRELAKRAKKVGIEVAGSITNDRVNHYLAKGHLLVNTSLQEGFSNTFIQAWMRNVPVISLEVDPDNVLATQRIGRCSRDLATLITDVKEVLYTKTLRQTMGNHARAYAFRNHTLENFQEILDLFEE